MEGRLSAFFIDNFFKKNIHYFDFFSVRYKKLYVNFRVKKTLPVTFNNWNALHVVISSSGGRST